MRQHMRAGFTLVEILIVVVILGILAAIVVPQFTQASSDAVKGALQSQLQTINSQVELYRVKNSGNYPSLGTGTGDASWGPLVGTEYLKEAPVNGFTGESTIVSGITSANADSSSANGWVFDATYTVWAVGYDPTNNLLHNETGFTAPTAP